MMRAVHERVLITGAAGFIGSHLAERYLAHGSAVHGIDNLTTGNWENFPRVEAEWSEVDVVDRKAFYKVGNDFEPDLIFHCAASYSDPNLWHRDAETNVLGSINAAIAANYHGAKLVYFNTSLPPITSYAISKIAGEQYIRESGADHMICRLANIYGPRNISGPIPTFFKRLTNEQPCTVVRTFREMIFVDDLVDAVVLFLEQDVRGTIDVCPGTPVAIRDLYDAVAYELGVDVVPEERERDPDDVEMMELNPRAAAQRGWKPKVELQDGIHAAVEWYRSAGVENTYTHLKSTG